MDMDAMDLLESEEEACDRELAIRGKFDRIHNTLTTIKKYIPKIIKITPASSDKCDANEGKTADVGRQLRRPFGPPLSNEDSQKGAVNSNDGSSPERLMAKLTLAPTESGPILQRQICSPAPRPISPQMLRPISPPVPRQICSPAPRQICSPAPRQICSPAPSQICSPVPSQICSPAPRPNFPQVLRPISPPVSRQICSPVPRQICFPAPRQICSPVPSQICSPVPSQICSPAPRPNSPQVLRPISQPVARQICSPVPRQICSPAPRQICTPAPSPNSPQICLPVPRPISPPVPSSPKKNNSFLNFTLDDYTVESPDGFKTIKATMEFEVHKISRPIGLTVLHDGSVVVGVSGSDAVHMFDDKGSLKKKLKSSRDFKRPTDMVTLDDGSFAVRDDGGVHLFDANGDFMRFLGKGIFARCFGLASDGRGHLVAINVGNRASRMTNPGETDVLFIEVESGLISRRIELADVIVDKEKTKCRFLSCDGKNIYVVDLGLDCVYVINLKRSTVRTFGGSGKRDGQFIDPAGMAVDMSGNMIIADSRNHRLQIFNKNRQYLGKVVTSKRLNRPSGIAFDRKSASLFVLNLWADSLVKFRLHK